MQTAGSFELAYASRAILGALMEQLIASNHLSASAATDILAKAIVSLNSCGNLAWVPGSIAVVGDIRSDLAKHGVK
jgi:hypothetical protein